MITHHKPTMNLGACMGYTSTLTAHRLNIGDNNYNMNNGESFFDKKNYRWIIICLDSGYSISIDLIDYMQDHHDLLKDFINRLNTHSNKWKLKLRHQSTLSSYHTTKHVQIQTVRSSEKVAQLIQSRCDAIQQVISEYKKQVDKMYPSERFGTIHKHYRSNAMSRLFKIARSSLDKISDELDKLHEKEKTAENALSNAKIEYQNLELNEIKNKQSKLTGARDHQENKQRELQSIQRKIARKEKEYEEEQKIYREKAMEIYEQCRVLEQERLDQIRETLIRFIQAIHSSEYSNEQDEIYGNLLSDIDMKQNSIEDLDFWARTYRIKGYIDTTPLDINQTIDENENTRLTTIEENTNESVPATEEEQSTPDKTTTSTTAKPRKKKNSTMEPTTPTTS